MASEYHESLRIWKNLLAQGLSDDGWEFDWTSLGTVKRGQLARARIIAKSEGIWAASGLVAAARQLGNEMAGGAKFEIRSKAGPGGRADLRDGQRLRVGEVVCEWTGPARTILTLERPFLNLASYAGGIATRTSRLVSIVRKACPKNPPRVTATRKTLPGYRDIAVLGVQAGGGYSHRVSLSGGVLIKENHVASAGGIAKAIQGARAIAPHLLKIEIEVRDERELSQALQAGAEVVMLDNFTPAEVRKALKLIEKARVRPVLEVSGGINEETIAQYAIPGVDLISVGSLTHSVQAIDLSLLMI